MPSLFIVLYLGKAYLFNEEYLYSLVNDGLPLVWLGSYSHINFYKVGNHYEKEESQSLF